MKLKKLVSLALAGVLAVSMLAGCKANSSSSSEQPATGVNAATVVAALNMDKTVSEKVTFSASASLQTTADKAMTYAQDTVVNQQFNTALLKKIDDKISTVKLPKVGSGTYANDKVAQSYTFVANTNNFYGATDKATVEKLVQEILKEAVNESNTMAQLPAAGETLNDYGETYHYEFKYTADVAVTSATNANGQVTYYAVVTLTRTPSRVAVKA